MLLAMKRIMPALVALVAVAAPAWGADRRYSVTDFDRLVVEGPYTVRVITGRATSAAASGSQQAIDRVSIEVVGRTLRIRPNRSAWGGYPGEGGGPVTIEVTMRELRAATVAGPGSLAIDRAAGLRVDLALEGNGHLSIGSVAADNLTLGLIGAGRVELAGTVEQLRATVHGTGEFDGARLRADGANITTDTAGRITVGVSGQATVVASGLGEVEILGNPACTVSGLSAAQVRCGSR